MFFKTKKRLPRVSSPFVSFYRHSIVCFLRGSKDYLRIQNVLYSSKSLKTTDQLGLVIDSIRAFEAPSPRNKNRILNKVREKVIVAVINNTIPKQ